KPYLDKYCRLAKMNTHYTALCQRMLSDELPTVPATQPAGWGIPVPVAGFESQRISAWFELGPFYLAITHELCETGRSTQTWKDFWYGQTDIVQFFGFDSCYFHAILFPALFHAYDAAIRPPAAFVINEFYRLDGRKFSTSRKHAI